MRLERNNAQQAALAKAKLLAMMNHEIRTPLNGVLGIGQLLADTDLSAEQEKYVEILLSSGKHLMYVINDILDYSKLDANKLTLLKDIYNPLEAIQEVVDMMQGIAQEKI